MLCSRNLVRIQMSMLLDMLSVGTILISTKHSNASAFIGDEGLMWYQEKRWYLVKNVISLALVDILINELDTARSHTINAHVLIGHIFRRLSHQDQRPSKYLNCV